jgi:small-conductance mechanosensitive channel
MDVLQVLERVLNLKLLTLRGTPITGLSLLGVLVILVLSFAASRYAQHLVRVWCERRADLDSGLQFTAMRLARYLILTLGVALAVQFVGIDLTSLAVVLSFLSVGIGFGMQNVASNFISGLIILFERPVKPGDWVTIGNTNGAVQEVNLRSTVIKTVDNIAIIVPNSQFISQEVVNWSYGDAKIQLHIPVGVAYGSDVELVTRTLLAVARQHPQVLDEPAPRVWLTEFGDSALNFELLAWLAEPYQRRQRISELNFAIETAFRHAGIQIPFPQRDVHIKSPGMA